MSPQAADETRAEQISRPKKNKRKAERGQLVVAGLGRHHRRQTAAPVLLLYQNTASAVHLQPPTSNLVVRLRLSPSQPHLNLLSTSLLSLPSLLSASPPDILELWLFIPLRNRPLGHTGRESAQEQGKGNAACSVLDYAEFPCTRPCCAIMLPSVCVTV
ncbi:hypothetical protein I7I50_10148 [Histoplasma capsulatum G186AR]|uniref:Uncharacterized protein n=1 Tax=Ajellomyces capsulatus TaxID=5037 RepID=A0A8H7Z390_AJECA|nr:hypothetical protein I7I52_01386 [Histoplasma capsulatum]QSS68998.1 hypothetical protein I7I50_10148 [Histoplasma capsulatum G186AR]